ncbi:hypothetical protein ScPMuIL_009335 [Solemya velum]
MEGDILGLKSGYLLKQSNRRWRVRWFILQEDEICCHPKRHREIVLETIPLRGCSVVCPCLEENLQNKQGVFKINTPTGSELYFQAAGKIDRDSWAHAIGAVIRSISTSKQVSSQSKVPFRPFRAYANVSEIMGAIQEPDAGVEAGNHVRNGIVHKNCFRGNDVVDWLLRWSIVRTRNDGSAMAQTLLKLGHLQEVDLNDGSSGVTEKYNDGEKLYRFTSVNMGGKRNSYYSSDSDSSSADEDEEEDDVPSNRVKRGKVLQESFILKKRNFRKGWQVTKFILRDVPPSLEYFKASLLCNQLPDPLPSKLLDLALFSVENKVKETSESSPDHKKKKGKKFYLKNEKGKRILFKPKDDTEHLQLTTLLQTICISK